MGPVEILMLIALVVVVVFELLCWAFWRLVSAIGYRIGLYLSGGTSDGGQMWRRRIRYAVFIVIPGCYILLHAASWGTYKYHCSKYKNPIVYPSFQDWQQENGHNAEDLSKCRIRTKRDTPDCQDEKYMSKQITYDGDIFKYVEILNKNIGEYCTSTKYLMLGHVEEMRCIAYDAKNNKPLIEERVYRYTTLPYDKGSTADWVLDDICLSQSSYF